MKDKEISVWECEALNSTGNNAYIEENEQRGAMCRQRECELTLLLLWHKNTVPPQDKNANFVQTSNYATYSYRATV